MSSVHVLLLAFPGIGHVNPMLQLACTMARAEVTCKCSLVIPTTKANWQKICHTDGDRLRISYIFLPASGTTNSFEYFAEHAGKTAHRISENARNSVYTDLDDNLENVGQKTGPGDDEAWGTPHVVVSDMFVFWARDVASELGVPFWVFMPSPLPAAFLFFSAPTNGAALFPNELEIPGLGIFTEEDFPVVDPSPAVQGSFRKAFDSYNYSEGMLINDLENLYPAELVAAARPPRADPRWQKLFVGPLTGMDPRQTDTDQHEAIRWLNKQPARSVVFVALGSWCDLPAADIMELAHGLSESGKRVLWAHRGKGRLEPFMPPERVLAEQADQDALPLGYREATKDRICLLPWVPQTRVLSHPSVAIFVSHCGWNSTVEALYFGGVPIVCLPIGAEQGLNAEFLSERLRVGPRLWRRRDLDQLERSWVCRALIETFNNEDYAANAKKSQAIFQKASQSSRQSIDKFLRIRRQFNS